MTLTLTRPRTARWLLIVVAFAVVAAACSGSAATADGGDGEAPSGPKAPTTPFESFEGETLTLAAFVGQPTVVNFWASWCPSCVAEMSAAFKPVQEDLGDQIRFVGMNLQDERSVANKLLEETGVQWFNAEDARGELYASLGGLGMPFTVFLSSEGEVLETHNGPLNESQLRDRISEFLLG